MSRIVFMLEERSLKVLLDNLLPRLLPGISFLCLAHEGKSDLEKSIPKKIRAWNVPGDRFVVVRDNDGGDCKALKQRLLSLCARAGRDDVLVRIACQELEAWYLGDPGALARAFAKDSLKYIGRKTRYRNPDDITQPSREIENLIPKFQKISGARRLAPYMERENNRSRSSRCSWRAWRGCWQGRRVSRPGSPNRPRPAQAKALGGGPEGRP